MPHATVPGPGVVHATGWLIQKSADAETAHDLTGSLPEQWWVPVGLCVLCCAVGLWMIRSMVHHRRRDAQIERAARASGMKFSEQDGHGLARTSFRHFSSGDGRGWTATNVVTRRGRDGLLAHAFDARNWSEFDVTDDAHGERTYRRRRPGNESGPFDDVVRRHHGSTRSAAITDLPLNAPRLMIARENIASKLFAAATRIDLDVESELFNRSYHVISDDRDFARVLLDARVVDLMTRTEGRISFELVGARALLVTNQLEPELMPGLVRLAEDLRTVIPQLAVDRWPRPGAAHDGLWAAPR